jgi:hypothetical protein
MVASHQWPDFAETRISKLNGLTLTQQLREEDLKDNENAKKIALFENANTRDLLNSGEEPTPQ